MAESKKAIGNGELEKIRDYLQDSKKNIDRLKKGKKPRRKLRFVIAEHKFAFTLLSLMLMTTPFIPLMLPGEPPPIYQPPNYESVELTVGLIDSNFTDQDGYPVYEKTEANTSSELIILSSLTNSMLLQAGYLPENEEIYSKISLIQDILINRTFRDVENLDENLTITEQIIGLYTLVQAYFSLQGTNHSFSSSIIGAAYATLINNYFDYNEKLLFQPTTNSSYFIDQALVVWLLTTYQLVFDEDYIYHTVYPADYYVDYLLDSIFLNFVNYTNNIFYSEYNVTSGEKAVVANSLDLSFLSVGLSRIEKLRHYYFYYSSYYVHQKVVNDFIDENWIVHETYKSDDIRVLKNQAYFALSSYLMSLNTLGSELVNSTKLNYLAGDGFYQDLTDYKITAESCLYGLLIFASNEWSKIQIEREYRDDIPTEYTYPSLFWSLLATLFLAIVVHRKTKKRKNSW